MDSPGSALGSIARRISLSVCFYYVFVSLIVLWSVAGLAAFRFIGSVTYLIVRAVQNQKKIY